MSALSLRRTLAKLERKIQAKSTEKVELIIAVDEEDLKRQMDLICEASQRGLKIYVILLSNFMTSSVTERDYDCVTQKDIEKHMSALALLN